MIVARPTLRWQERIYLPALLGGLAITFRHFVRQLTGKTRFTVQYPEQKQAIPAGYRGAPTLVRDEEGREKCVSCQLCEFICPPRAIKIVPGEIGTNVEKGPQAFDIDMTRCIYCGYCEEVCPEEAIYLRQDYAITGRSRAEMLHDKAKLYELGGVMPRPIKKWANK